ncbi:MAG: ComEC/Rec2 family competence protein, partial [Alphaproteobacteria bacterium]
ASRLARALLRNLAAERERWALWAPVAFGVGIALYFSLSFEPPLSAWLAVSALVLALAASMALARLFPMPGEWAGMAALGGFGVVLILAGAIAAAVHTRLASAPILRERLGPVRIEGRIDSVEVLPEGQRLTLDRLSIPGLSPETTPARARVRVRDPQANIEPGQTVRLLAILGPPPQPAAPGAFDFQRQAFFNRLGAVGFALGPVETAPEGAAAEPATERQVDPGRAGAGPFKLWLSHLRHGVAQRVRDGLPGPEGAVAAALMTGDQAAIPSDILGAMRNSGLAHLLAVSGLHFALVTGFVFLAVRGLLALIPALALAYPIKKWAALAALAAGALYFLVTKQSPPTERAFVMVIFVFLAVLVDRTAISMRTLAWAAMAILILEPASLLGASFQLSFAAVVALIAAYEAWQGRALALAQGDDQAAVLRIGPADGGVPTAGPAHGAPARDRPWWRAALLYVAGIAFTSLITTAATAPFLAYNFSRFPTYGFAANLVAVPITGVWIMPWAVGAFLLMPFGLEGFALTPMGWGIAAVIETAGEVASLPGAVIGVAAIPVDAAAIVALGGLWLCLWRRRWRYAGLAVIACGIAVMALHRPPDVLVDGEARLLGVRGADGGLMLSSLRTARFERESWLRLFGSDTPQPFPANGSSADGRLSCDSEGCLYRARGRTVALAKGEHALAEDCGRADAVISLIPARRICRGVPVIDRFDLWRRGAHAIWLDRGTIRIESVRDWQGERPWTTVRGDARR